MRVLFLLSQFATFCKEAQRKLTNRWKFTSKILSPIWFNLRSPLTRFHPNPLIRLWITRVLARERMNSSFFNYGGTIKANILQSGEHAQVRRLILNQEEKTTFFWREWLAIHHLILRRSDTYDDTIDATTQAQCVAISPRLSPKWRTGPDGCDSFSAIVWKCCWRKDKRIKR